MDSCQRAWCRPATCRSIRSSRVSPRCSRRLPTEMALAASPSAARHHSLQAGSSRSAKRAYASRLVPIDAQQPDVPLCPRDRCRLPRTADLAARYDRRTSKRPRPTPRTLAIQLDGRAARSGRSRYPSALTNFRNSALVTSRRPIAKASRRAPAWTGTGPAGTSTNPSGVPAVAREKIRLMRSPAFTLSGASAGGRDPDRSLPRQLAGNERMIDQRSTAEQVELQRRVWCRHDQTCKAGRAAPGGVLSSVTSPRAGATMSRTPEAVRSTLPA